MRIPGFIPGSELLYSWPKLVKWRQAVSAIGIEGLHFHDLRRTRNTLTALTGASTRDLMTRGLQDISETTVKRQEMGIQRRSRWSEHLASLVRALRGTESQMRVVLPAAVKRCSGHRGADRLSPSVSRCLR